MSKNKAAPAEDKEVTMPAIALKKGVVMQEDFGKFLAEYKAKMTGVRNEALRIFWGLGAHVHAMLDDSVYGDHKIDEVCEALEVSKSTLYGYKRLYEVYEQLDIEKFIKHGIGFHTIYQLLRLKDDSVRKSFENKLVKKEIKTADLARLIAAENGTGEEDDNESTPAKLPSSKASKQEEDDEQDEEPDGEPDSEEGEVVDPTPDANDAEREAEKDAPPADKAAADKIRSVTAKVRTLVKNLDIALDQVPSAIDAFDMVEDLKLGESLQGRMSDTQGDLIDLKAKVLKCIDELKKVCI